MTVVEIRKKYPNPRGTSCQLPGDDEYCVLGAACRVLVPHYTGSGFPWPNNAAKYLEISLETADMIARFNDHRQFDKAWAPLGKALKNRK